MLALRRFILHTSARPLPLRALCTGGHDIRLPLCASKGTSSRSFAATAEQLVPILRCEFDDELENRDQLASDLANLENIMSDAGFVSEDVAGMSQVTLRRVQGDETMLIQFDCEPEELENDEGAAEGDEDDAVAPHPFTCTVEKGGEQLVFHCVADEGVSIVRISFPGADAQEWEDKGGYLGPPFDELDEELQEAFNMWLYERDIDSNVADYVQRAAASKESREYCHWLDSVATFVNK